MPFEISANPVAMNVYNNLAIHQAQASTALAKISSGEKTFPTLAATDRLCHRSAIHPGRDPDGRN